MAEEVRGHDEDTSERKALYDLMLRLKGKTVEGRKTMLSSTTLSNPISADDHFQKAVSRILSGNSRKERTARMPSAIGPPVPGMAVQQVVFIKGKLTVEAGGDIQPLLTHGPYLVE